jgi:hypothetical protein
MKKKITMAIGLLVLGVPAILAQVWQEPQLQTTDFVSGQECYLYNVGTGKFYTEGNSYGTQSSVDEEGLKCKFLQSGDVYKLTNFSKIKNGWRTSFVVGNGAMFVDGESVTECWWKVLDNGDKTFKLMAASPNSTYNQANYPGAQMGLDIFENEYRTSLSAILMESEEPGDGIYFTDWAVSTPENYEQYMTALSTYKAALKLGELLDEARTKGKDVSDEESVYNNTESTLSEIQSATGSVTAKLLEDELSGATPDNPVDVTDKFITNPRYANNDNSGWNGVVQPGINAAANLQNAEFFNTNFDTWQDLINLPAGKYRLSIQGFYRAGLEGNALSAKQNGTESGLMNAELYVTSGGKTSATKIQSIFSGAPTSSLGVDGEINMGEWWIPNNMSSASFYFSQGYYLDNSVDVVVTNSSLRIGIRKNTTIRRDWVMIDNWKLEYLGK